ncbi:MAG: hypothetical protein N4A47_04485 [Clostridia bacterium]|nr:hypothetical protein [Clostridia bacterium]
MRIGKYKVKFRFLVIVITLLFLLTKCFGGPTKVSVEDTKEAAEEVMLFYSSVSMNYDENFTNLNIDGDVEGWKVYYKEQVEAIEKFTSENLIYTTDVELIEYKYQNYKDIADDLKKYSLELLKLYDKAIEAGEYTEEDRIKKIEYSSYIEDGEAYIERNITLK